MQHKLITVSDQVLAEIAVLEKAAQESVTRSATKYLVFAIGLFGLVVVPMGVPVALAAAAPMVFIAVKRAATNGSAAAYIKQTGNFAPLLNDRQLLKLTKLVGKDIVLAQLLEALEDGKYLSGSALDYLECCGVSTDPPNLKTELDAIDQRLTEQAVNTVDVVATTDDTPKVEPSLLDEGAITSPPTASENGIASISLIDAIALDPKSLLLSAPTRVGKGGVAASAIRATQRLVKVGNHPTIKTIRFWWLTPKQFAGENWYWETCDQFHNPDLDAPDRFATVRSIYQFIVAFGELSRDPENPTVLGLDEFSRLMTLTAGVKMCQVDPKLFAGDNRGFDVWLVDRAIHSASMLQAGGYWVWVIIPANTVGGKGFSKGDADSFNVITLASPLNMAFADGGSAAFAAPEISADHPIFERGFAAGYRKRDRLWYFVPDFGEVINRRTAAAPVELKNRWLSPLPPVETEPAKDLLDLSALAPIATVPTPSKEPESKPLADYFPIFRYRPLLIWGPQGSGKSTVAREIVRQKQADGQTVYVLNPHGSPVEWNGAEVVGAGKDYDAIHDRLQAYESENKTRYENFRDSGLTEQEYQQSLVAQGQVISPICEEMSNWYRNLKQTVLAGFSLCCLTESRKVMMPPVFVAHDRTLDFVGLKRGANLKEAGLVELELLPPDINPETRQLISCGRGTLRIPGGESFPVHFDNFDAQKKAFEGQPASNGLAPTLSVPAIEESVERLEPPDENGVLIIEYLQIQPECQTYSQVIERLGTKLERRGLIERRTVDCLKAWLVANNLPLLGGSATASNPETEPVSDPPPHPRTRAI